MAVKTIITEPNKLLRQISKPVESVGKEEQQLMKDMLDTMYDANGIGLAAIQIGIPKRIIVMDIAKDGKKEPRYFVNPVILNKDPIKNTHEEGCLSVPEQFAEIDRPSKWQVVSTFSRDVVIENSRTFPTQFSSVLPTTSIATSKPGSAMSPNSIAVLRNPLIASDNSR